MMIAVDFEADLSMKEPSAKQKDCPDRKLRIRAFVQWLLGL